MDRATPGGSAQHLHPLAGSQPQRLQAMAQATLTAQGHHPGGLAATQGRQRQGFGDGSVAIDADGRLGINARGLSSRLQEPGLGGAA